jgi:hypothetical protein
MSTKSTDKQDWRNLPRRAQMDLLKILTVQRLVALFPPSEDASRYNAQILYARDFVHSVAEHLCVTPPRDYGSEEVIEASIAAVAGAYDELIDSEPEERQCKLDFKPWRTGILVN